MSDEKKGPKPSLDNALGALSKGFGKALRAAQQASGEIAGDIKRVGLVKTFEDSGREIARAAGNVGKQVSSGLQSLSEKISPSADRAKPTENADEEKTDRPLEAEAQESTDPYPTTRDEFETRFGKIAGDWPRTAEAFEKRFGHAPPKVTAPPKRETRVRIGSDSEK